ncbi:MMS19 nucleotide excision repair protein-like protein [Frankliniella fusca]|uniref:MMS19 nucleotide excision repair protein-like protein n=1 Tax=Frankliniella fusca TaxID=407009 RepID=A0AAE1L5E5_9NEOP|nr:MMS19 nucleotide excision repair protein-like protein [Frankliniella fusca]
MVLQAVLLAAHALVAASASMLPATNTAILTNRKNAPVPNRHCALLEQQKNVNLEALAGYWYAVETIGHREEDRIPGEGYKEISLCPLMFLSPLDNSTDLRLLWEEPLGKIEYRFRVVDPNDRGFWMSLGQQNGEIGNGVAF